MATQGEMTDFEFVDSIYRGGVAAKADRIGIDRLSVEERSVVLVWFAKGIVGNGGFIYFYSTDTNIDAVADAFKEIGLAEAAEACLASKKVFIGGVPPKDKSKRLRFLKKIEDEESGREPWAECDAVIWNLGDEFDTAVADYIRRNPRVFNLRD